MTSHALRLLGTLAIGVSLAVSGCTVVDRTPADGSASAAVTSLDVLTVAAPRAMTGYSRDHFPHWRKVDGDCDTRDVVLKRDGTDVRTSKTCAVTSGRWLSAYDGKTMTDAGQIDIDHVVPLANAWRSGADGWSEDQRADFANDLTRPQLIAVSRASNRAKSDQDPSTWKPPSSGFWCEYARRWVEVKRHWRLSVTKDEKNSLREMLGSC